MSREIIEKYNKIETQKWDATRLTISSRDHSGAADLLVDCVNQFTELVNPTDTEFIASEEVTLASLKILLSDIKINLGIDAEYIAVDIVTNTNLKLAAVAPRLSELDGIITAKKTQSPEKKDTQVENQTPPEQTQTADPNVNPPTDSKPKAPEAQSDDYDNRKLDVSETEKKSINQQQTKDEKRAAVDGDPDVLDTLSVGSDGLVVVPEYRRDAILNGDPDLFKTNYTPGQYGMKRKGPVDSTNITTKNTGFTITVSKGETEDEIVYEIEIENTGKNCLFLDQIIAISGTDISNINPDTKKSENEPKNLPDSGVSLETNDNLEFLKKNVSNIDNLQSQENAPFSVGIPQYLKQKDNQSEPLCATNQKKEEEKKDTTEEKKDETQKSEQTETTPSDADLSPVERRKLYPYITAAIEEAGKWMGFYEDLRPEFVNKKDRGENKPNIRVDDTGNVVVDTSLMEAMYKYSGFGINSRAKYCMAFSFMIAYKAAEKSGDTKFIEFLKEAKKQGFSLQTQNLINFAKQKGYYSTVPVPGCMVVLRYVDEPSKGHGVLVGFESQVYSLPDLKWAFETYGGNTLGEGAGGFTEGTFLKNFGFKPPPSGLDTGEGKFTYVGSIIPDSVRNGKTDEELIKLLITDKTDLKEKP